MQEMSVKNKQEIFDIVSNSEMYKNISESSYHDLIGRCGAYVRDINKLLRKNDIENITARNAHPDWDPHVYLIVKTNDQGNLILDPTLGQVITNINKLSQEVFGKSKNIFFGTRDEARMFFDKAHDNTIEILKKHNIESFKEWKDFSRKAENILKKDRIYKDLRENQNSVLPSGDSLNI